MITQYVYLVSAPRLIDDQFIIGAALDMETAKALAQSTETATNADRPANLQTGTIVWDAEPVPADRDKPAYLIGTAPYLVQPFARSDIYGAPYRITYVPLFAMLEIADTGAAPLGGENAP